MDTTRQLQQPKSKGKKPHCCLINCINAFSIDVSSVGNACKLKASAYTGSIDFFYYIRAATFATATVLFRTFLNLVYIQFTPPVSFTINYTSCYSSHEPTKNHAYIYSSLTPDTLAHTPTCKKSTHPLLACSCEHCLEFLALDFGCHLGTLLSQYVHYMSGFPY